MSEANDDVESEKLYELIKMLTTLNKLLEDPRVSRTDDAQRNTLNEFMRILELVILAVWKKTEVKQRKYVKSKLALGIGYVISSSR